jgi:copper oxidase (laccase) domain-containing protein
VAGDGEVAAIHAGWRGLVAGVIEATIEQLQEPLRAAIGPCICVAHYEVGYELVAALKACGVPREVCTRDDLGPRPHVNLRAAAEWKLEQLGVPCEQLDLCTWEDPRFPSYRRNGPLSGRMASVIGLRC